MFERFITPECRGDGGTGIGLSIVREIMRLHQGRAAMEAVNGAAANAYCIFPQHQMYEINGARRYNILK